MPSAWGFSAHTAKNYSCHSRFTPLFTQERYSMAIVEVKVPQLSESIAEATMLNWKKKAGEAVAVDEILIEIETDKVVLEVPAPAAGVLTEILQGDGATVTAEQLIAGIDPDAVAGAAAPAPAAAAPAAVAPAAA